MDYTKAKDFIYSQNLLQSQLGTVNGNINNLIDSISNMIHVNYSTYNSNPEKIAKDIDECKFISDDTKTNLKNELEKLMDDRTSIVANLDSLADDVYNWATC